MRPSPTTRNSHPLARARAARVSNVAEHTFRSRAAAARERARQEAAGVRDRVHQEAVAMRWPPLGYVPALLAYTRVRRRLGVPRPISLAIAYGAPVAVSVALPRGRGKAAAVWLAHMWAYKQAYEIPFDDPEKLERRLQVDAAIRADSVIGRSMPPTQWLQSHLRRPPHLSAIDYALTLFYLTWEAEPHLALAWILLRHPSRFPGAALRLGATFDATVAGYFLTPAAPPWWASEKRGRMNGEVHRVTLEVMRALRGKPRPAADHESGANPWASMPSDHFASAVTTAIELAGADARAGAMGWAYALTLGSALVYTGEHYVVDLLAGGALALAVHGLTGLVGQPLIDAVQKRLGPGPPPADRPR